MDETARAFIEEARRLLSQDYLPKIERCLERLTDEQIWWRANPDSNSVGNLLLHLAGNARQWVVAGVGGAEDVRERQAEFDAGKAGGDEARPTASELLARLRVTLEEVDAVLAGLSPATLLERRRIQGLEGVVVLNAVFHVVEHFSTHTGQIVLLTKLLTAGDLAFYDFAAGAPRANWHKSGQLSAVSNQPENQKP
ncbi:MAG TPA: DinB family protein [Pyrinomonadaceae bacterium]|nr:DinB family protein [Pyrinomonadaceae bacterium]